MNIKNKLRKLFRKWLGVDDIEMRRIWTDKRIEEMMRDFNTQMSMVGLDIAYHRKAQTSIIFVSHLGRDGQGTVKVVEAQFQGIGELMEFIRWCERSFKDRVVYDAPPSMFEEIQRQKRRGRL